MKTDNNNKNTKYHICKDYPKGTEKYQKTIQNFKNDILKMSNEDIKLLKYYYHVDSIDDLVIKLIQIHCKDLTFMIDDPKCLMFNHIHSKQEQEKNRDRIYRQFSSRIGNDYTNITPELLQEMVYAYDTLLFDGLLKQQIQKNDFDIQFKINGKDTFNTEGYCIEHNCSYTITIPVNLLQNFKKGMKLGGFECDNLTQCLQIALEHEMTHLVIFLFCRNSNLTDYHGPLFQTMVMNLFGHTEMHHEIL